jgi:hypothetical protein
VAVKFAGVTAGNAGSDAVSALPPAAPPIFQEPAGLARPATLVMPDAAAAPAMVPPPAVTVNSTWIPATGAPPASSTLTCGRTMVVSLMKAVRPSPACLVRDDATPPLPTVTTLPPCA